MVCFFCSKRIRGDSWIIRLANKENAGPYCSKEHAENDSWGPIFRDSKIVKKSKNYATKVQRRR